MNFLYYLSEYFTMILPIAVFVLVLAAFAFLMYLRKQSDKFFACVSSLASDIKRIADAADDGRRRE